MGCLQLVAEGDLLGADLKGMLSPYKGGLA